MALQYEWQSFQGSFTDGNRDYCGISERPDATLYTVIDGSTRGPNGGDLARELACRLVDQFLILDKPVTEPHICNLLQKIHEDLRHTYPGDSASYIIVIQANNKVMTIHAGDCRLGRIGQDKSIDWLTGAHTLANAIINLSDTELAAHPNRHQLTRSFRPQRFQRPEYCQFPLVTNDTLLIATDGFWAEMDSAMQMEFLDGKFTLSEQRRDDRSCLLLRRRPSDFTTEVTNEINNQANIYIKSIGLSL
jgi:serine/threonine protein phosphatase PrpC